MFAFSLIDAHLSTYGNDISQFISYHVALHVQFSVPPDIAPFVFPALAEGSRAQVACNVHRGDLPLNLTWLKDGTSLISSPGIVDIIRFDLYSSILKISSVNRADSGNYTCVASNPARIVTHTAALSVSGN